MRVEACLSQVTQLAKGIRRTKTEVFSNGLTKDAHVADIFLAP